MILNSSSNKVISKTERVCATFISQACGLMFRSKQNLVMPFETPQRVSLHSFFVFYPFDVLLLNERKKIIEIKRRFRPFLIWKSSRKAKYLLELAFPSDYKEEDQLQFI